MYIAIRPIASSREQPRARRSVKCWKEVRLDVVADAMKALVRENVPVVSRHVIDRGEHASVELWECVACVSVERVHPHPTCIERRDQWSHRVHVDRQLPRLTWPVGDPRELKKDVIKPLVFEELE